MQCNPGDLPTIYGDIGITNGAKRNLPEVAICNE